MVEIVIEETETHLPDPRQASIVMGKGQSKCVWVAADAFVDAGLIPGGKADLARLENKHASDPAFAPELLVGLVGSKLGRVEGEGNNLGLLARPGLGEDLAVFSDPLAMREPGVGIPFLGTLGSRALASQGRGSFCALSRGPGL